MIQPILRKLLGAFCLALVLLALAGCGRRGPPELPDASTPDNAQPAPPSPALSAYGAAPIGPSTDATLTQNPSVTQPQAPKPSASIYPSFVLDPLIK